MALSDHDWQLLNALHDGELEGAEARDLQARVRREPELQAALADLKELSFALKPLRPSAPANNGHPVKGMHWRTGAVAALFALMAFGLGFILMDQNDAGGSPLGWHQSFLERQYVIEPNADSIQTVSQWVEHQPDLSSANLTFVDIATAQTGDVYFHYSGVNGCRLTVGAHSVAPDISDVPAGMRTHTWPAGGAYFSMLAQDMDAGKFAAILLLMEDFTRDGEKAVEMASVVRSATETALPCA